MKVKNFCDLGFERSVQGFTQCFFSGVNNLRSYEKNVSCARRVKLRIEGKGQFFMQNFLQEIDPITSVIVVKAIQKRSLSLLFVGGGRYLLPVSAAIFRTWQRHVQKRELGIPENLIGRFKKLPIPEMFHTGTWISEYICSITQQPIREAVADPTTNPTNTGQRSILYEKQAILVWLKIKPLSPVTRKPLHPSELHEAPFPQAIINYSLRLYIKN